MNKLFNFSILVVVGFVFLVLLSFPAAFLWNECLVPAVSFAKPVEWTQMLGIMVLINILTKDTTTIKGK